MAAASRFRYFTRAGTEDEAAFEAFYAGFCKPDQTKLEGQDNAQTIQTIPTAMTSATDKRLSVTSNKSTPNGAQLSLTAPWSVSFPTC